MSEDDAKQVMDPNRSFGKIHEWMQNPTKPVDPVNPQPGEALEFKSIAQKKRSALTDRHTHGLTPEKEVENLKHHGTPFNMADDGDVDPAFDELFSSPNFDMDASDDELMGMEIKEDTLEVSEGDISLEDFEDERD
jgi:hypothetical protein